jgi:5'-3' exonuclease
MCRWKLFEDIHINKKSRKALFSFVFYVYEYGCLIWEEGIYLINFRELSSDTKNSILGISADRDNVIVLDMSYHLYRFYYVHKDLSINNNGVNIPTGHIYGFLRLIAYLKRHFSRPAIIICVDGHDDVRKEVNSAYKGNRSEKEFSVHGSTDDILEMCGLMDNVYYVYDSRYEADDGIYTVATSLEFLFTKNKIDTNIYIYGSDRDLYQAVSDKVKVIKKFGKGRDVLKDVDIVGIEQVKEEFSGVTPDKLAVYRSIVGDSSDNLKGYERFPRKLAAYIATNGKVSEDGIGVNPVNFTDAEKRHYNSINLDFKKFKDNYAIMKAKEFLFELRKCGTGRGKELAEFYQMNQYTREVELLGSK